MHAFDRQTDRQTDVDSKTVGMLRSRTVKTFWFFYGHSVYGCGSLVSAVVFQSLCFSSLVIVNHVAGREHQSGDGSDTVCLWNSDI